MYQELEKFIKSHGRIDQKELQQITSCFKPLKTVRNEMLCNIGQICSHFYFIRKGCLRLYEIDDKGNDITGYFALEDSLISANTSFILQKPSRDCLVSLEHSELLAINRNDFYRLVESVPQFGNVYHKFIEFAFIHSQMRIYSFLGMEGIDKLRWVMEHEPKLLSRISSKAVASYLGMTNSTLSKLRTKL
ncbi:cyclic nucleotide-binding domain-containing protein [Flagellimonas lutimaris]|uniref:Cyclic nucleotide-binding domain-containing protein n=1 Tax=Flagellimonas lutimaris TaxID=475082 RepID=A0A3A1NAR7_9FLAO|nr:cyclic nucleotide-binding domain-containing protein [Allomuricauda lutimaris]RIV31646.1 cyclic nucleotide-binding domain-containing protein [Allomuricauda lutimaris]